MLDVGISVRDVEIDVISVLVNMLDVGISVIDVKIDVISVLVNMLDVVICEEVVEESSNVDD
jgi:hypothetical protein